MLEGISNITTFTATIIDMSKQDHMFGALLDHSRVADLFPNKYIARQQLRSQNIISQQNMLPRPQNSPSPSSSPSPFLKRTLKP